MEDYLAVILENYVHIFILSLKVVTELLEG